MPYQSAQKVLNSQKMKERSEDLHGSVPGPLCIYYSFQLKNFMKLPRVLASRTLILMCALGSLLFLWIALPSHDAVVVVLSYYISFCHVWLLSLSYLVFPKEKQKGRGSRGEVSWRGAAGKSRGREE